MTPGYVEFASGILIYEKDCFMVPIGRRSGSRMKPNVINGLQCLLTYIPMVTWMTHLKSGTRIKRHFSWQKASAEL